MNNLLVVQKDWCGNQMKANSLEMQKPLCELCRTDMNYIVNANNLSGPETNSPVQQNKTDYIITFGVLLVVFHKPFYGIHSTIRN